MRPHTFASSFAAIAGAMKLIQYAHWERDRFKAEATPPPALKLDLSDNCIAEPAALIEDLKT